MKKQYGNWRVIDEWTIGGQWAIRFFNGKTAKTMQISKYRGADDFDKYMVKAGHKEHKAKWHGKWYVNTWYPEKEKLFKTKAQALKYAIAYMRKH